MKKYIFAILFGLFITNFGFFAGLQISPTIGNIIVFPLVISAIITSSGFLSFHKSIVLGLFLFTSLFWASIFILIIKLKTKLSNNN